MRHKWRRFNDLAIKTVAQNCRPQAALWRHSLQTTLILSQFSRFVFKKTDRFCQILEAESPFGDFSLKNNKSLQRIFHVCNHTLLLNNTAFSTATHLPATTALPIPSVGCATRHTDLPILEGGSAQKRTP
jgi:hypothetical protein